jgi:hypothetical protein
MPKRAEPGKEVTGRSEILKGWKEIAEFLGEPVSVVRRWRLEGMPVVEQGRLVTSSPDQLNDWLGRESGKPVHVVTADTDLASELKRGMAFVKRGVKHAKSQPTARRR